MPSLVTTAYFPPIEWFAAIARDLKPVSTETGFFFIEACENYQKQSWRNRCLFLGSQGPQTLNFPIVHRNGTHNGIPITEVEIDWSTPWLDQHEKAIVSAYKSSAFFDYYKDELFDIIERRPSTLFEFNSSIIDFFLEKTGLPLRRLATEAYLADSSPAYDYRDVIHPKKHNSILEELNLKKPYFQVFAQKHGFVSGLSIMDLLFNEGPESVNWLVRI